MHDLITRGRRVVVLVAVAVVAATAVFVGGSLATSRGVDAEPNASARARVAPAPEDLSIDKALAAPEPVLPGDMPTARPAVVGRLLDPLSPAEVGYARYRAVKTQKSPGERVDGSPGYQFISADLPPGAERARTRAVAVTSFDYAGSAMITQLVDLRSGKVTERRTVGAQPPPAGREAAYAMDLLVTSPAGAELRQRFEEATGTPLTSADQLHFRAGTYTAGGPGAEQCGVHRCLTFQGASEDGDWFYFGDTAVDLTDGIVRTIS